MGPVIRGLALLCLMLLAACGSEPAPTDTGQIALTAPPSGPLQCVPYARSVSGIEIRGDAWSWWSSAEGRYARGKTPRPGSVLVFARSKRLRLGHVSVVTEVRGRREILISHANWGSTPATRGKIAENVPVIDVSPGNDWSAVRVWNGDGAFGRVYPAYGFIYPNSSQPILTSELPVCIPG
jgi:hypothetical protein